MLYVRGVMEEPCRVMRPEELQTVIRAEEEVLLYFGSLFRTLNDMEPLGGVAVINDRVVVELHTVPFAFPLTHFLAIRVESRIDGVTQGNDAVFKERLAYKDRVTVFLQFRNNRQV